MHSNVFVTTEWRERITGNFLVLFVCLLCFFFHFSSSLLRSFVRWFVRLHFLSLSFAIAVLLFVNTIYNIVSAWSTTVVGTHNICTCQCTHGVVFKLGVFIFLLLSCVWFRSFAFGYVVKLKHIILSQFHHENGWNRNPAIQSDTHGRCTHNSFSTCSINITGGGKSNDDSQQQWLWPHQMPFVTARDCLREINHIGLLYMQCINALWPCNGKSLMNK